ncbi:MAG: hypothetical protein ACYDHG_10945 [Desulfomonilaceae bacterium]
MGKSPFKKATIIFCFVMALMASGWGRAEAQVPDFGLGSIVPFKSLQTFFGPLFPATCIGDTFRSEFGMALSTPLFDRITLTGKDINNPVSLNLLNNAATMPPGGAAQGWDPSVITQSLDGGPVVYDFFGKLRVWRFAGKVDYSIFEARSRREDGSGFFFDSVILTGDVDIIQGPWLTAGGRFQFYLNQPYFKFNLGIPFSGLANGGFDHFDKIYFSADAPWTIGAYIRYVPPEILGFPVHFDAYADFPLKGSPLKTYGVAFVFRPQVYRFDRFTRLKLERTTFTISGDVSSTNSSWSLDMLWNLYGAEFGIYF